MSKEVGLPAPVILPYSIGNPTIFWATYVYQFITGYTFTVIHVVTDTTFFGLLLLIKRHQEILKSRLRNLMGFSNLHQFAKVNAEKQIKQIIVDHQHIFRYLQLMSKFYSYFCENHFKMSYEP